MKIFEGQKVDGVINKLQSAANFQKVWPNRTCGHQARERIPIKEEIAWFAGFFDGEGSITIVRNPTRRKNKQTPIFRLSIIVDNTDPRTIYRIKEIWGVGGINFKPYTRKRKNAKPVWRWHASCNQAARILWISYPYFIGKKDQAEVAILFQHGKAYRNSTWNNRFIPDSAFLEDGKFKDLLYKTRMHEAN